MAEANDKVLQADPSPFFLKAGPVGVLLVHGFTGTPREMWPLGDYLHARDFTVSAPLLPGHGGVLAAMNRVRWRDWVDAVQAAYVDLKQQCASFGAPSRCFIGGFSLGALLTLWMAAHYDDLAGIMLYAPALWVNDWRLALTPLARFFVHSYARPYESEFRDPAAAQWSGGFERYPVGGLAELWLLQRYIRRNLARVRTPALVVYVEGDASVHPRSGPEAARRLAQQTSVETLVLHDSSHLVVADQEWETVAAATYRFVQRYAED